MILKGNKWDELSVVNVHTDKKIKRKRQEVQSYRLSPNPKKYSTEYRFLRDGDWVKIRPPVWV